MQFFGRPLPPRRQLATAATIAASTAAYGIPFGALATAAGLSPWQTQALSLLMYGGASQLAMVSALLTGTLLAAASATAVLLSCRVFFYSVALARLGVIPARWRPLGAQLISDESVAATANEADPTQRSSAFWVTGFAVFTAWNISTFVGAQAGRLIQDPGVFGLDAVAPAALLALIAGQLRDRRKVGAFVLAGAVAIAVTPLVPAGVPVLLALMAVLTVSFVLSPSARVQATR